MDDPGELICFSSGTGWRTTQRGKAWVALRSSRWREVARYWRCRLLLQASNVIVEGLVVVTEGGDRHRITSKPIPTPVHRVDGLGNQESPRVTASSPPHWPNGVGSIACHVARHLWSRSHWLSLAVLSIQSYTSQPSSVHLPHAGPLGVTPEPLNLWKFSESLTMIWHVSMYPDP